MESVREFLHYIYFAMVGIGAEHGFFSYRYVALALAGLGIVSYSLHRRAIHRARAGEDINV